MTQPAGESASFESVLPLMLVWVAVVRPFTMSSPSGKTTHDYFSAAAAAGSGIAMSGLAAAVVA
jgi:hypothetical protein